MPKSVTGPRGQRSRDHEGRASHSRDHRRLRYHLPCISSQGLVEVRNSAGILIWATKVQTNADSVYLSPDIQALSDGSSGVVERRNGAPVQLPVGFHVEGWLDPNTVVGRVWQPNSLDRGNLSWISLGDSGTIHDLGFKGDFVATLA